MPVLAKLAAAFLLEDHQGWLERVRLRKWRVEPNEGPLVRANTDPQSYTSSAVTQGLIGPFSG